MKESEILKKDREESILLSKRMKPEERIVAYFHHSQLMNRIYQAGVDYRKRIYRKR
ncbi:MAG: hypothetical protein HY211_02405 [Candidatus Omnitrophica bacterium]|nr:hypothetical protein [Candidatus Omnitrophota bacterium]